MELTRRNFLMGAGVAAGAAAMAGLAGCSNNAAQSDAGTSNDTNASATANGTAADATGGLPEGVHWSWEIKPELPADDQIAETYDCDICVVGLGVAGPAALYYAMQKGYNVVALQKLECMHNGGGGCGVFNTKDPEAWGLEGGYDFQTVFQEFVDATCGKANHKLIRRMIMKSGPAVEWIAENVPGASLAYLPLDGNHLGTIWEIEGWESTKTGVGVVGDWMCNWAVENGGTILYETPATQLIQDDSGRITGVIAQKASGEYVKVNATEGVILCSGDICDNEEMLQCFNPQGIGLAHFNARNGLDGDATKMGLWVGAAIEKTPANTQLHLDVAGNSCFKGAPWLTLNTNGERFMNENQWFEFVTNAILEQPGHECWQIIDSHLLEHGAEYNRAFYPAFPPSEADLQASLDSGTGFKADTIEELAGLIGLDADALKAQVDRFNGWVDAGLDEDFYMDPKFLQYAGIKDAPFYAFHYVNGINCTDAGLVVDDQMRVLTPEGQIIPGLYAAGNASGSLFGPDYPARFGGFSVGRALTGGMVAVQSIMGTVEQDF